MLWECGSRRGFPRWSDHARPLSSSRTFTSAHNVERHLVPPPPSVNARRTSPRAGSANAAGFEIHTFVFCDVREPPMHETIENRGDGDLGVCSAGRHDPTTYHLDRADAPACKPWTLGEVTVGGISAVRPMPFVPGRPCYGASPVRCHAKVVDRFDGALIFRRPGRRRP